MLDVYGNHYIDSLSSFQKYLIDIYGNMWAERMLRTEEVTQFDAETFVRYLYTEILKRPPVRTVVAPSPARARDIVMSRAASPFVHPEAALGPTMPLRKYPRLAEIQNLCGESVRESLNKNFISLHIRQMEAYMTKDIFEWFMNAWWGREKTIGSRYFIEKIMEACCLGYDAVEVAPEYPYLVGYLDYSTFARLDYVSKVFGLGEDLLHFKWFMSSAKLGPIFPLEDICVVTDTPGRINRDPSPTRPGIQIEYRDGFTVE